MKNKNIVVFSHRRSGTHLTIDSIKNNFPSIEEIFSIDDLEKSDLSRKQEILNKRNCIVKSHSIGNLECYFEDQDIRSFLTNSNKIYVIRDGRDVMVSLFNYRKSYDNSFKSSFKDFIRSENDYDQSSYVGKLNRMEFWAYHVSSWLSQKDILAINYNKWLKDFDGCLNLVSDTFKLDLTEKIVDSRIKGGLKAMSTKVLTKLGIGKKRTTAIHFNKGTSGQYKQMFDDEDLLYYQDVLQRFIKAEDRRFIDA